MKGGASQMKKEIHVKEVEADFQKAVVLAALCPKRGGRVRFESLSIGWIYMFRGGDEV